MLCHCICKIVSDNEIQQMFFFLQRDALEKQRFSVSILPIWKQKGYWRELCWAVVSVVSHQWTWFTVTLLLS